MLKQMDNMHPSVEVGGGSLSGVEVGVGDTEDEMLMHQACSGSGGHGALGVNLNFISQGHHEGREILDVKEFCKL